jgi:branched-chain amino acid transport system permease protein
MYRGHASGRIFTAIGAGAAGALVLLAPVLVAAPAAAQQAGGPAIGGTLRGALPERTPVEGVEITVKQGDEEIGTATSDADGKWRVEVPAPGTYEVHLDTDTLPEGVALRDPERADLDNVQVRRGLKPVLFAFGEPRPAGPSRWEQLLNLTVDGIRLGLILAVMSVGLSLIFGVTGLVNFAHGELVTFGALVAFFFSASVMNLPLVVAGFLAVVLGGVFGLAHERLLFRPLRRRRTGNVSLIVVTIGLGLFLRNLYLVVFEGRPRPYDEFTVQSSLGLGPVTLRPKDVVVMVISVLVLVGVGVVLQRTRLGTAMRAVSDSSDLSEASGIDVEFVILATWIGGAALAALGGVLQGVSETVQWDMGFGLLLLMFAAVVLGGLGTAYGAMVGGLIIGLASQLSTYWFAPKYRIGVALAVLILAVLLRPQGILGRKERIG